MVQAYRPKCVKYPMCPRRNGISTPMFDTCDLMTPGQPVTQLLYCFCFHSPDEFLFCTIWRFIRLGKFKMLPAEKIRGKHVRHRLDRNTFNTCAYTQDLSPKIAVDIWTFVWKTCSTCVAAAWLLIFTTASALNVEYDSVLALRSWSSTIGLKRLTNTH